MPSIAFTEPEMSYHDSSDDSIRRLTDDYGRHRLTDLLEADESEEDGVDYLRSSRRKRYSSNSSAVLTEDTDSFIIGQRVWVGGTKPGTIAYIGETQFAPGEWAGIALDEPIGKNDGSVAGIRYFQCENKKGVFSRLTRLTRVPLEQPGMGSNETFTSPNGTRRSPVSPTGSTRGLLKSPVSLSNSNTSLTSSVAHVDFKIGDRVIIKSTQGSKVGTVRYMGLTDFAPGEWVGVELDDPRGKNDGSVEGKRYFECRPHFGLFAPIAKVSKSPSKYKPGACVVHSGPGLPPSGMKRANSKESVTSKTSVASSVRRVRLGVTSLTQKKTSPKTTTPIPTRTALQDVLREKQQHIEQLLKERDLERAEITRAASQADDAEQRFFNLKQEFEQYRSECESKIRENMDILSQLKVDRTELLSQLEDERRRNEDLQFRFEEAAITKSDIEEDILVQSVTNESNVAKIKDLESRLAEERQKGEGLEAASNKLFEAEENLIKARDEIDQLRIELIEARNKRDLLEAERVASAERIDTLQKQVDSAAAEDQEKTNRISKLTEEISAVNSEHELVKREAEEHKKRSVEDCWMKDAEIQNLRSKLAHSEAMLADQHRVNENLERANAELVKENHRLKMELSGKAHDLEISTDKALHGDELVKATQHELEKVKSDLYGKITELERLKDNFQQVGYSLRTELEQTRENLKVKITEVEEIKKECHLHIRQKDQQLQEATNTIVQNNEEIRKLNNELTEVRNGFEVNKNEIHTRHAKQIESQDAQLMALSAEIQQKNEEITKSSIVISKLEEDLCAKNGIIEKYRLELESYQNQHSNYTEASTRMNQQFSELSFIKSDLERRLSAANEQIASLTGLKERLEAQIQQLTFNSGDANEQLERFKQEIQAREGVIEKVRAECATKLEQSEKNRYEIESKYQQSMLEFRKIQAELEEKLRVSLESGDLLKQRCDSSTAELAKIRDEYRLKINQLEQSLHEKELSLSNLQIKGMEIESNFNQQLKMATEQLDRNLQDYHGKIMACTDEALKLKEELARKSEEVIEANAKASHVLAQAQQSETEIKQKFGEDIRQLQFELSEKSTELQKALTEIQLLRNDCQNSNNDVGLKDQKISELNGELQSAKAIVTELQEQLNSIQLSRQQTTQEHEVVQNQCKGLLEQVAVLTEKVRNGESLFRNMEIEHKNTMQLIGRLKITELQKQQCLQQLEAETNSTGGSKNCEQLRDALKRMQTDDDADKVVVLQKQLEVNRNQLAELTRQFEAQKLEILRLQEELLKAQETNTKCRMEPEDQNSLIQHKELAENQIKFLNSIIVDIQKKNEEQKARIEILESGHSPGMANELNMIGSMEKRQLPPRMYCDICEHFDLHETEDCPKQNTDLAPGHHEGNKQQQERPYCEICEAFGHHTEDCQEDQTF